jgi:hypothetical protein
VNCKRFFKLLPLLIGILATKPAYADGIDITSYFARVNTFKPLPVVIILVVALLLLDYGVNLLFIGLLARKYGQSSWLSILGHMITLTLLGQIADRVGAGASLFLADLTAYLSQPQSLQEYVGPLGLYNLVLSGFAIAALSSYFLKAKWNVTGRARWGISLIAGVFTNPLLWSAPISFLR